MNWLDALPDLTLLVDAAGMVRQVNCAARRVLGIEPAVWHGSMLATLVHPEDWPALRESFAELVGSSAAESGKPVTAEFRLPNAGGLWRRFLVLANLLPPAGESNDAAVSVIVSARAAMDYSPQLREKLVEYDWLEKFFRLNPYPAGIADPDGRNVRGNVAMQTFHGPNAWPPPPEFCLFEDPILVATGTATRFLRLRNPANESVFQDEIWWEPPNMPGTEHMLRTPRCIKSTGFRIVDADGELIKLGAIHEDITDRRLAEQREDKERAFLNAILDTTRAAVAVLDAAGNLVRTNPAFRELTGFAEKDESPIAVADFLPPADADRVRAAIAAGDRAAFENRREGRWRTRTGEPRIVAWSESLLDHTEVDGVETVMRRYAIISALDITEQRAMELQLQHAGKLGLLGKMAAGVAHEINNPLAATSLRLQNMREANRDRDLLDDLDMLARQAERLRRIANQLAAFIRQDKPLTGEIPYGPVAVHAVIEEAVAMLRFDRRSKGIEIAVAVPPSLPPVLAYADRLQQVVINLGLNAFDAMPEGGKLEIGATADANTRADARAEARAVRIDFRDTGHGIEAAWLQEIFAPSFTTRAKGMGLGLTICRNYIESHGGHIAVESAPNRGTTFTISLPAHPHPAANRR